MNPPASDRITAPTDIVEVTLPLEHRHASTVRVVAAALGADAGFDVDEIDDLRLGVDEAVAAIVAAGPSHAANGSATTAARLVLHFETEPGAITVRTTRTPPVPLVRADLDGLALRILEAVSDRFEVVEGALVLTKRAASHDGD
jgi:anti-sigma regulatory factor (Ser/Thr protein kinase)